MDTATNPAGDHQPDDRLETLLRDAGEEYEVGGNRPIRLDAGDTVWFVAAGRVELFAVPLPAGEADRAQEGPRTHIATLGAGRVLFGLGGSPARVALGRKADAAPATASLIGVAHPGTRLIETRAAQLTRLAREPRHGPLLEQAVEGWVDSLFERIRHRAAPRHFQELRAGAEVRLEEADGVARTAEGVVWVRHVEGRSRFLGRDELVLEPADVLVPISEAIWLVSSEPALLSCVATGHLLRSGALWEGLARFHRLFLRHVTLQVEAAREDERQRVARRIELDATMLRAAHGRLASVLGPPARTAGPALSPVSTHEAEDPLLASCRLVFDHQGLVLRTPPERLDRRGGPRLRPLCEASRIRYRSVLLRDGWWRRDNGPLLGLVEEPAGDDDPEAPKQRRPVALLPSSPTSYDLADPAAGTRTPVDDEVARDLVGDAYMFYPALPEGKVGPAALLRLAVAGRRRDLLDMLAMGLGGGLLSILVPVVTGELFGRVIPGADRPQLLQLTLALIAAALGAGAFQVTRSIAVLRLTGKVDGSVQAAVWDRLLELPSTFFRRFTVGDLTRRAMGIDSIRDLLLGNATTSFLGLVFSVFSFGLLFYYSWRLALLASGLIGLLLAVTTVLAWIQLRYQRQLLSVEGRIASLLFGLISGVAKLRTSGAEKRAYARWADHFTEQRRWTFKIRKLANFQLTFNAVYSVATSLSLYALMGHALGEGLAVSRFLAFSAAFGQVQASALEFVELVSSLLTMKPIYERLEPILEEAPEVDATKIEAGELSGDIEFSHLSFRYQDDGPLVLNDVSFRARPGEFVALVGPSGSGKSTSLRLLLGFERPTSGSIYYDGQDLASLDMKSVRRQIGVVLQNGRPISGDIFSNIVGISNLGIDTAWEAARMAGLADDIEAMPMGMHTVISEGGGTFSGGQIQRVMIARAIVNRPRILFFDEATSALDNRTQEIVGESLERLKATRIVVAHRLSTIENADKIVVIEDGRVVEEGTYDELITRDGLFARMAKRQVV